MSFVQKMRNRARALQRHLVLPEGSEERTMRAAERILAEGIAARVSLVGEPERLLRQAEQIGVRLSGIELVDPARDARRERYAEEYHALRKHKGLSGEQAFADMAHGLRWGCMMLRMGDADAVVAGAGNSTANVLRAAFTIIKTRPGIDVVSSCFVMLLKDRARGSDGRMIFSDCAIIPSPSTEQLTSIASAAAESCRTFLETEPVVAMLSFSTKGSAETEESQRVRRATELLRKQHPELIVDGELQLDAAIVPAVGAQKAPGSPVNGGANTLIFPDLQSGNIGYKLVQRLAGAQAIGPILQGLAKPVSDLSRGCSVDDIINTAAFTIVQSGRQPNQQKTEQQKPNQQKIERQQNGAAT